MGEPFSLVAVAKPLVGLLLSKGSAKALDVIKEKGLVSRAVTAAAPRCAGYRGGREEDVRRYLSAWTSAPEFDIFLQNLAKGTDIDTVLQRGVTSFLEHSQLATGDRDATRRIAERMVAEFLQALRDEIYSAPRGEAAMMRRGEQMHAESLSRFDNVDNALDHIRRQIDSFSIPAREAVSKYLAESHEWQPLNDLLSRGDLVEASDVLEKRVAAIDRILEQHPDSEPLLRDHRQDLLLRLAAVLTQRGQTYRAEQLYEQAKSLRFSTAHRRQQALVVLFNLHRVDEYETLLQEGEVPEPEKAEIDLLVLKEAWSELASRVPKDATEFRPLYLGVLAELEREWGGDTPPDIAELSRRLDRASKVVGEHPLQKVQLAIATVHLLQRVVHDMMEAPGLDRGALIASACSRTEEALTACARFEPESGANLMLQEALTLYGLLQDEDQLRRLEQEYNAIRGSGSSDTEWKDALSKGKISQAQYLYLTADALLDNPAGPQIEAAVPLLQSALHLAQESRLRTAVAQRLVNVLLGAGDTKSAEGIIEQLTGVSAHDQCLLMTPVVHKKAGRSSAIQHLTEALHEFPRSLPLRRMLTELLISEINATVETDAQSQAVEELIREAISHAEALHSILPTPQHDILRARAYFAGHNYSQAVTYLSSIIASGSYPIEAGLMRAQALVNLLRFDEAAQQLAEVAERTDDTVHAANAAGYWLHTHEYKRATEFLEWWIERHPEDPFLATNLAISLIITHSDDQSEGRRAFNLLSSARRYRQDLKDVYLWMSRAAAIAGKDAVAQRYFQKAMPKHPPIPVRAKEDFDALSESTEGGMAVFRFEGEESLRAFLEWQRERTDALSRLMDADLLSYGDLFNRNGRAWDHWIQWTQGAVEQFQEHKDVIAIKAPWPFTSREDIQHGLLLDITALLTLSILGESDLLLRAIRKSGRNLYIRSTDMDTLNGAVAEPADHLFGSVELPYEALVDALREHNLLRSFTQEEVDRYNDKVPEPLREHLGNHAFDFGLALELNDSAFVADRHDAVDYEPEAKETNIVTSAALLRALVEEGIVSTDAADGAAETDKRFLHWREASTVAVPKQVVLSAFALPYWYQAGLLTGEVEGWLRGRPEWPRLHVGPFGRHHLLEQAHAQRTKRLKADAAARLYLVIRQLVAEGVVEIIPSKNDVSRSPVASYDPRLRDLWPHALSLLELAKRHRLDVWADDRVLGYFLWPFGHPLPIPQFSDEVRSIKSTYQDVHLRSTEDLLFALGRAKLIDERIAEKLGFELLRLGYRPLSFRLALTHLFRSYTYKSGSPRYQPLLQALRALLIQPVHLQESTDSFLPKLDSTPPRRLILASVLPKLIAEVWYAPCPRSLEERRALADDLLRIAIEHLQSAGDELEDGLASFWVGLLATLITHQHEAFLNGGLNRPKPDETGSAPDAAVLDSESDTDADKEDNLSDAVTWFTESLLASEHGGRRKRVVRGIEDYVIDFLRTSADRFTSRFSEPVEAGASDGDQTNSELKSQFLAYFASTLQPFIYPLFQSELLNEVDPLLRRALGVVARHEHEFKVHHLVTVPDLKFELEVPEDDVESFALNIALDALRGDQKAASVIRADLSIECSWQRTVPEIDRETQPGLPDRHPVPVKVLLLILLLRDEAHQLEPLFDVILFQLHLLDPVLGKELLELKPYLTSPDEATRRFGRQRFSLAIIGSTYFEAQRDLAHCVYRLRRKDALDLERYLSPDAGWLPGQIQNPLVGILDEREWPFAALIDVSLLSDDPAKLVNEAKASAESLIRKDEATVDCSESIAQLVGATIGVPDPLFMARNLLVLLSLSTQIEDGGASKFTFEGEDWTLTNWIHHYLQQVLQRPVTNAGQKLTDHAAPLRSPHLKAAHACMLRLAAHAVSAPQHLNTWKNELNSDEHVLRQWIYCTIVLSERLLPLLVGRYDSGADLQRSAEDAVHSLKLHYESPAGGPDIFNPFLMGPHLLDHEVAAVLHILAVFIQHSPHPEEVLDLQALREMAEQWVHAEPSKAREMHEHQREHAMNTLKCKMPLSPADAARALLDLLPSSNQQ